MRTGWIVAPAAVVAAASLLGCTEDALTGYAADTAPGQASPTVELVLTAGDLPMWRDTTYIGFSTPSTASESILADSSVLRARGLARVKTLPDSLFVDTAVVAVESFSDARIRLVVDTARSVFPEAGVETSVYSLNRGFDADEATWTESRPGEAWTTPGGDLGPLLGSTTVAEATDTVLIALSGADTDSLLKAWRAAEGEPGFAVVATGAGTELHVRAVALLAGSKVEGRDTLVEVVRTASPETFIYDPPQPSPGTRLRLAGQPSARVYVDFELPETIAGIDLRGSTINRATVEFRPVAAPETPFVLSELTPATSFRLLTDPFTDGEKTPIGEALPSFAALDPDSLEAGRTLSFPVTELVQLWSAADPDSIPSLRVGFRPLPESVQFGYWEFASAEDSPAVQPVVRLLVSPRTVFRLP